MDEELVFRKAEPKDVSGILNMYNDIIDNFNEENNYLKWEKNVYPNQLYLEMRQKDNELYLAKIDNKPVGAVILNNTAYPDYDKVPWTLELEPEKVLIIHTLAVAHDQRKSGVGRKILQKIIEMAKENGIKSIRFDVLVENTPAAHFYEKCDFTNLGTFDLNYAGAWKDKFYLFEMNL